jgi:hypothetical protein
VVQPQPESSALAPGAIASPLELALVPFAPDDALVPPASGALASVPASGGFNGPGSPTYKDGVEPSYAVKKTFPPASV